jgi:hypothetical protein
MRRALVVIGILTMAYAVLGALLDDDVKPFGVLVFLVGVLVAHDGVLLPLVLGAGALIGRYIPARRQPPVRVAALVSLAVSVVALPLVLGFGRSPDNPSVLPLPYGRGLLLVLALVWAVAIGAAVLRTRKEVERPQPSGDG